MKSVIVPLAEKLKTRELTSVALTEQYLSAIERENPRLNAYVRVERDEAIKLAERADSLIREGKGTCLTGIPFILKDNIATDGLLTTCCSKILQGHRPIYDATAYAHLKACGAVLLGKGNMDEFAMGSSGETSIYGAALNPHDTAKVAGGSSGGVASAVAGGIAAYGLGSDTGGSVRQPASFCGAVGFKPTYGAISRYGLIAYASSLDQIGVIAQSVSDAAIVFDAVRGKDEADATSVCTDKGKTLLFGDVKGKKFALVKELLENADGGVRAAVERAAKAYSNAGAEVCPIGIPALKLAVPAYYIIACAEASSNLGRYDGIRYGFRAQNYANVEAMAVKTRTQGFGGEVKKRIMLGTYVLSAGYFDAYYKRACILRDRICKALDEVFSKYDFLMSPTVPQTAFPVGYVGGNAIKTYLSDICCVIANIAGLPAISTPCGYADGMPVGLQITGKKFADAAVLNAAYFSERSGLDEANTGVKA